ncbi:PHD finger domain, putative [Pediculus humanus corporis]|uniref:PHD finger domain, putative n=1 Tax=Pediculus humanus subsp. corporis TaxID=121224 RepID=E0VTX3_PEDHC|nr:PHD finger domain, putative [Pediculus humanus corporis]EEB16829.1 PHD finger domain, putative [Pediculus humanus corporis]
MNVKDGGEDTKSSSGLLLENDKVEKLRRNEIINCICGITEEDGLMIQCDICLCWQHGHCAGIFRETDVPDKYTCAICKNPYRGRPSMKYLHDQEWLKEGTLPSLSFRSKRDEVISQRKTILKRSYDLSGSISLLSRVIHSLRLKVNIAEKKDHPKLWLWAKKWTEKKSNRIKDEPEEKEEKSEEQNVDVNVDGVGIKIKEEGSTEDDKQLPKAPEPEAPIDSAECKLNLLDHLIHYQTLVDARLSWIESLVAELESMQDDAVNDEGPDRYPRTKATVQMLLRDLSTMKKIAII